MDIGGHTSLKLYYYVGFSLVLILWISILFPTVLIIVA